MYINKVRLQGVKCFTDETMQLTHSSGMDGVDEDRQKNWNVILGENGDGKSTLLRAIAACLMDARTADRVVRPIGWIRGGQTKASMFVEIERCVEDDVGERSGDSAAIYQNEYFIVRGQDNASEEYSTFTILDYEEAIEKKQVIGRHSKQKRAHARFLRDMAFSRKENAGWLACGYGAFRRLPTPGRMFEDPVDPSEAKFVTLFDDNAALVRCERWLKDLQLSLDRKKAEGKDTEADHRRLEQVKARIGNLLPEVTGIEISKEITFAFRDHTRYSLPQLSDGYRSMFALIVDILRWLERAHPGTNLRVDELSGVVLIDEIDAHLHPRWQREVGFTLTKQFPNLQFIVTTHSPFVAMAAGEGSLSVLRKDGNERRVDQDVPNPRGWLVDRVLAEVFDLRSLRDPVTEKELQRYQELRLARGAQRLSPGEADELTNLEVKLAKIDQHSSPSGNFALDQDIDLLTKKLQARRLGT